MLSSDDEAFLRFWGENREKERNSRRPFMAGLSIGFAFGLCIILTLYSGWYERANMEANTRLSSFILMLAILLLSFFMAFFYRKFRWEMQEQRYLELVAAKNKAENIDPVQP